MSFKVDIVGVATSPPNISQMSGLWGQAFERMVKFSNSRLTVPRILTTLRSNDCGCAWISQGDASCGEDCPFAGLAQRKATVSHKKTNIFRIGDPSLTPDVTSFIVRRFKARRT